jgi:hypothetical protein
MTLGQLIEKLKSFGELSPKVKMHQQFSKLKSYGSYRGYYEDFYLSFTNRDEGVLVKFSTPSEFAKFLEDSVLNKTFIGYKGGEYIMVKRVDVYCAAYGCLGEQFTDVVMDCDYNVSLVSADYHY